MRIQTSTTFPSNVCQAAYTVYLFSGTNSLAAVLVSVVASLSAAGRDSNVAIVASFVWVECHLLAFEIMNQITGLEEDVLSKPYRPIPSGRITVSSARILHYFVICVSALLSIYYGTVLISTAFFAMNYLYNECALARYWPLKSFFSGYGYACLMAGAAYCLRNDPSERNMRAIVYLFLMTCMTSHAQDFRDQVGDAAIGRKTIPLSFEPFTARATLSALVLLWSAFQIWVWSVPSFMVAPVFALAGAMSASFLADYCVDADRRSYTLYYLWLLTCSVLPFFHRLEESSGIV
ncbi:UbiA prenyltransferase family [Schizophyllum commune]